METDRSSGALQLEAIEPTVFFAESATGLRQAVDLTLNNEDEATGAYLNFKAGYAQLCEDIGFVAPGVSKRRIWIPDLTSPYQVEFTISTNNQTIRRTFDWQPMPHWEIHLVQRSHHDLGYTDLPSNLLREHDEFMEQAIIFCEQTREWPEESKFRYVAEQGWSILHYLEHASDEWVQRALRQIQEGRIEVTALLGNETSELCGPEEQIRLLYPSFRLKRHFGVPIRVAQLNDIPGVSWGLASVLAGAGIRYFIPGIPDYFSWEGFKVHPWWDEEAVLPRDMSGGFWWEGPDAQKVLFWHGQRLGHPALLSFADALQVIPRTCQELLRRGYPFDLWRARLVGGGRDNCPPSMRFSEIAYEWNSQFAYPKLIVSTNSRFMQSLETRYGDKLRTLRGDIPGTDYPIGALSTAKETGVNRLTHDVLLSAEKLASAATLVSNYDYPADALAEAYDAALLYDEHTWGMDHPIGPAQDGCWSQKSEFAYRAAALAHDVLSKSSNRIADQVRLDGDGYHLVVFNSLAQERTDVVRAQAVAPAPCGRPMRAERTPSGETRLVGSTAIGRNLIHLPLAALEQPFELIDVATGQSVPYQIVTLDGPLAPQPYAAQRYALGGVNGAYRKELVFIADKVPALGFRTYRLAPRASWPRFSSCLIVGERSLENRYYRIDWDASGKITHLWDKGLARDWADQLAAHGIGQLVVRAVQSGETSSPGPMQFRPGQAGPIYASVILSGQAVGCPQVTQEIILYDQLNRVDFANRLLKDATPFQEFYFAFPLAMSKPQFRYEGSNSVIAPITDQLPGTNTDAYAMQHWLAAWDEKGGVAWASLESPVAEVGGLWPGYVSQAHHGLTPKGYGHEFLRDPAQLEKGHIYSYAMDSNFRTNFQPVQVADALFRYSLTSYPADYISGRAGDFGWGVSSPLWSVVMSGPQYSTLAPATSFCEIGASNVRLLTIKAAEDGDGLILRLAEGDGDAVETSVKLPFLEIKEVVKTNLVEEGEEAISLGYDRRSFSVKLAPYAVVTLRCRSIRKWPTVSFLARF